MKELLYTLSLVALSATAPAQSVNLPTPAGSMAFGKSVTVLTNGNYVVTDPNWGNGTSANVGAIYLYNGQTNTVIATLVGSNANDQIGFSGVTALSNGNYVVSSSSWDNGSVTDAGAVTWGSGTSGVSGVVSSANSLIGSTVNDYVGNDGVTALSNGHYVVRSSSWDNGSVINAGAVTWGSGSTGIRGVVSNTNSLVGSRANDNVGNYGVTALNNGHYVVSSSAWDNGSVINAGAVTWVDGSTGVSGVVSSANSLVGSRASDQVGFSGITALSNGNYVVSSSSWDNGSVINAGAVTWGSGTSGVSGVVSSANSLVGSNANDQIGFSGVTALSNGNYVVRSSSWSNGGATSAGAVTWGSGTGGVSGVVSSANSLVGSTANDYVGSNGVTALSNGNYVVMSPNWDNGTTGTSAGAVTWGSGSTGVSGVISNTNSLVGSTANDQVGNDGITALSNSNYVVRSSSWNNGNATSAGAVTWGSGTGGVSGVVSSANSLVGSTANDYVGNSGVTALSNGHYVVRSSSWNNSGAPYVGAVTWGSGTSGVSGVVSSANSLVGSTANDYVGNSGVTALSNGHYVVSSSAWDNGSVINAGAVTWVNGSAAVSGVVSSTNSLVGSTARDNVGSNGVTALSSGDYIVRSSSWNNGSATYAGAVTWGSGAGGVSGVVSSANSLVGSRANDQVGNGSITALSNSNYIVNSYACNNGVVNYAGAVTLGTSAASTTTGPINTCNSVVGNAAWGGFNLNFAYNDTYEKLIVGKPQENLVTVFSPVQTVIAATSSTATNTASNTATVAFVDNTCTLVASLKPSGASPVSGTVTASVYVQATAPKITGGTAYVRRQYDISPATGAHTATARVNLYFTQADFDDYNANNGTADNLPTGPADAAGKEALRITQQHGTSATGAFGSYTGWAGVGPASVLIIPGASNVTWNDALSRWEVSFEVTGFSGFFVSGGNNFPLPVKLLNFNAKAESSRNRLDWNTATETEGITFEVTRSADGNAFEKLGALAGKGKGEAYTFYDEQPLTGSNYYRLNIVEPSGEQVFSNVVLVKRSSVSGGITVSPIPAGNTITISNSNAALTGSTVMALDMQGRVMTTTTLEPSTQMDIQNWPAGIYMLKFADGSVVKVVKQ